MPGLFLILISPFILLFILVEAGKKSSRIAEYVRGHAWPQRIVAVPPFIFLAFGGLIAPDCAGFYEGLRLAYGSLNLYFVILVIPGLGGMWLFRKNYSFAVLFLLSGALSLDLYPRADTMHVCPVSILPSLGGLILAGEASAYFAKLIPRPAPLLWLMAPAIAILLIGVPENLAYIVELKQSAQEKRLVIDKRVTAHFLVGQPLLKPSEIQAFERLRRHFDRYLEKDEGFMAGPFLQGLGFWMERRIWADFMTPMLDIISPLEEEQLIGYLKNKPPPLVAWESGSGCFWDWLPLAAYREVDSIAGFPGNISIQVWVRNDRLGGNP